MKRLMFAAVAAVCLSVSALPAQAETSCPVGVSSVKVLEDDTLWGYANDEWEGLYQLNPKLKASWRKFITHDGKDGVNLQIGETICGVTRDESGIIVPENVSVPELVVTGPTPAEVFIKENWGWGPLLVLLAGIFFLLWVNSERRKDPINSGPRIMPNGVNSEVEARMRFNSMAQQQSHGQHFDIQTVEAGTINGTMLVRYRGGMERPRDVSNLPAYRATVRFDNNRTEELYMLQACGNDLRMGNIRRYVPGANFVFTPDSERRAEPAPAAAAAERPAVEPVAPLPVAANEMDAVPEAAVAEGNKPVFACYSKDGTTPSSMEFDHTLVGVVIEKGGRTTISFLDVASVEESVSAAPSAKQQAS
jgi:hypothetical protein